MNANRRSLPEFALIMISAYTRNSKNYWLVFFGVALFVVYDNGNFIRNAESLMHSNSAVPVRYLKVALLTAIAILSYWSVTCALCTRSRLLRSLGTAVLIAGVLNAFVFQVSGSFPDADLLAVALQERFFAVPFASSNWKLILFTVTYSLALVVTLRVVRQRYTLGCADRPALALVLAALLANVLLTSYTGGRRTAFFGFNAIIESAKVLAAARIPYDRRASVAAIDCPRCPDVLFYIIDESINYEALTAIGSLLLQDAALEHRLQVPVRVFEGYAAGNHSSVSNYVLRLGVGKGAYPDSNHATLRLPNIFAYAKASHYKTIFYDAQEESTRLVNFMSQYDLADIDEFMIADAQSDFFSRDFVALDRLRKLVDNASPNNRIAILLIKNGIHFPYVNSLPPWLIGDLPVGCRSPDTSFSSQQVRCRKAQYEAALRCSVDQFMEKLFALLEHKNFALIYTSDHGQNLSSTYSLPHGSSEHTSACEISVPIVVAGGLFAGMPRDGGIRSHFQIPATLLSVLGHLSEDQAPGATLSQEWRGGADFLFDPFAKADDWHHVAEQCHY